MDGERRGGVGGVATQLCSRSRQGLPLCKIRAEEFCLLTDLICLVSRPGTTVPCLIISYIICGKGEKNC